MADAEVIDLYSLKVTELKAELKSRGLPISGPKADLIQRLENYMQEHEDVEVVEEEEYNKAQEEANSKAKVVAQEKEDSNLANSLSLHQVDENSDSENLTGQDINSNEVKPNVKSGDLKGMSESERKAARANRFVGGAAAVGADPTKLKSRAERFGVVTNVSSSNAEKDAALKRRMERFGVVNPKVAKTETDEKKKARSERFGTGISSGIPVDKSKIEARKARFGAL